MGPRREPTWLSRLVVDAIHADQLREHGGLPGVRDDNALESALARPRQVWHYRPATDVPALAAAYAFGLVKNHPYRDGNKRIGFLTMVTFLGVNGCAFEATDEDVVVQFVSLAAGHVSEDALASWIRQRSTTASR
ncbi:death-on-curing protein [Luteitalea sp. TBR-22]|uniref:type II toxin-antitoxin system death-on-curing family toxin n=1 Tax=Luteitalea sp. TBR-22 TaxID=2802971 RepID=UPI001AF7C146|nr:type II toxin-antitoxin system death-on-curing family toxin [Luteitalea sp. TBR-22]BCS32395.1 death-on-curing protein [Luteitalea sp. TBR-22]